MLDTIEITSKSRVYIGDAGALLAELLPERRVIVISDTGVDCLQHELIAPYDTILVGRGESAKSLAMLDGVYRRLIELGADRTTFILGVGGGVVTDIAGFVASTYMRGVEFGFVTTTLLGAVDASVGGKNGVNIGGYKNMVGTFSQPQFVICDVSLLHTLPDREFRAGLAEVIKTAILGDAELFEMLERGTFEALREDKSLLTDVVTRCVRVKASVVAQDEREAGCRRILNLGHTVAHAIEKESSNYSHGEAVAIGIYYMTRKALEHNLISDVDAKRIFALIERYGFDVELPIERKAMLKAIGGDKKRRGDALHLILPTAIGAVEDREVALDGLENFL
ncbi:MAG: 3-dehydroquinate synthase [Alistipes sp.]|nr:3-dehydroquinate synthase [Alistipes sp.]